VSTTLSTGALFVVRNKRFYSVATKHTGLSKRVGRARAKLSAEKLAGIMMDQRDCGLAAKFEMLHRTHDLGVIRCTTQEIGQT